MKFVIQHNLMNEAQLSLVKRAISKFPHQYVDLIPFSREITSDYPLTGTDYIPYGSTLLTTIVAELGWKGCHFDLSKMNYRNFLENHPKMMNSGLFTVKDASAYLKTVSQEKQFFIRPSEDLKQFSGSVLPAGEIHPWLDSMMDCPGGGSYFMSPEKEVVLCEPKEISAEWRWFIIGGKIVSGSMYRAHNQMRTIQETDSDVIQEAQILADMWLPMDCIVMDTALVGCEVKVIEFNCLNSSGGYSCDLTKVFESLWAYHEKL